MQALLCLHAIYGARWVCCMLWSWLAFARVVGVVGVVVAGIAKHLLRWNDSNFVVDLGSSSSLPSSKLSLFFNLLDLRVFRVAVSRRSLITPSCLAPLFLPSSSLASCVVPQDAASCPLSGLLDMEQRQAAAGRLNAAVLQSQQQEKGPWLPDLLRQLVYTQVRGRSFHACCRPCDDCIGGSEHVSDGCHKGKGLF